MHHSFFLDSLILWAIFALSVTFAHGQDPDPPRPPSLKTISVPEPSNLADFIRDKAAAILLGKALFWDMQVGSDGKTACATCHFNAGSDSRSKNQISPGLNNRNVKGEVEPDLYFDFGPNRQLSAQDFPFRRLSDPNNRASNPLFDSNDVVSSQGVIAFRFIDALPGVPTDVMQKIADTLGFRIGETNVRRVAPRHAPSIINAIFNYRNLQDGRAQNAFNGINNWGVRDPDAFVYRSKGPHHLEPVRILLDNASLASQAVAAPLSNLEMSAVGRTMPMLGRKLLASRPLAQQQVHPHDSVLGKLSRKHFPGLRISRYAQLVRKAFHPQWWHSNRKIRVQTGNRNTHITNRSDWDAREGKELYTLMEYNFSLYFGLAIQSYLATLVADDSPYDRFMNGDVAAISAAAIRGVDVFRSQQRGRCINCHEGAELTGASVSRVTTSPIRIRNEQAQDRGFNNIGVRPTHEDIGLGRLDPWGVPLSMVRQLPEAPICTDGNPCPVVTDGFFKVPGLRNIELTAPYFHNGGALTLRDVIDFYSRGGDFPRLEQLDGSEIVHLNILDQNEQEKADLEAWLVSLTDDRVRYRQAPFDHPQLFIPNGHRGDEYFVEQDAQGMAIDDIIEIPAVGRNGGEPLSGFLQ